MADYNKLYLTDYATKTDIPTTLPANGGNSDTVNNHTVETDVPTNAVFTDTIYDDTEVKGSIDELNSNLGVIGKCKNLLNPILQTTTMNGIKCTNNGDGTYTLNGTATDNVQLALRPYTSGIVEIGKTYRIVGCPQGFNNKFRIGMDSNDKNYVFDSGEGANYTFTSGDDLAIRLKITVDSGTTINNLVFKPMLTIDLNATYDDFVPYTGDGDTLTHDVAEINNNLSANIKTNTTNIATNTANIAKNATAIQTNTNTIAGHTKSIQTNATNIAKNTTDIQTNATNIADLGNEVSGLKGDLVNIVGSINEVSQNLTSEITNRTNAVNSKADKALTNYETKQWAQAVSECSEIIVIGYTGPTPVYVSVTIPTYVLTDQYIYFNTQTTVSNQRYIIQVRCNNTNLVMGETKIYIEGVAHEFANWWILGRQ